MTASRNPSGLVIVCNEKGGITRIPRDDFRTAGAAAGRKFLEIVQPGYRKKAELFMETLSSTCAAFDYDIALNLPAAEKLLLHFSGLKIGDELFLIAAKRGCQYLALEDEFLEIQNEQFNALRSAVKEKELRSPTNEKAYMEMTRLNNELANTQRELSQKNRELKTAIENIKTLHGLLPICSKCRHIRNAKEAWTSLETYIVEHTEATFSHGLCPACAQAYISELDALQK